MIYSKKKREAYTFPTPPQTPQLQNSYHKMMLTWEPTSKLNSCIIPWYLEIVIWSADRTFVLKIELPSADQLFNLEILIRSADRIFDLEILIPSADRIFDFEIV